MINISHIFYPLNNFLECFDIISSCSHHHKVVDSRTNITSILKMRKLSFSEIN